MKEDKEIGNLQKKDYIIKRRGSKIGMGPPLMDSPSGQLQKKLVDIPTCTSL